MTATVSATAQASARETKRNLETAYLLSPMQQGMLFHSLYAPESGVYFEQLTATLAGNLNVDAFRRAWQQVVDRHPILRTAFAWKRQDKPVQAVYKELALPIEVVDWRELGREEQERRLDERLAVERARGFDLSKAPLMRLLLVRTDEQEHRLAWSHHHILMDGWSMPILLKEVFAFYEAYAQGRPINLPPGAALPRLHQLAGEPKHGGGRGLLAPRARGLHLADSDRRCAGRGRPRLGDRRVGAPVDRR
jgi:hypothetical protein